MSFRVRQETKKHGLRRIWRVQAVWTVPAGSTFTPWRQVALNPAVKSTDVSMALGRVDADVKAGSTRRWVMEHLLPDYRGSCHRDV